jgi:hypothetical protein
VHADGLIYFLDDAGTTHVVKASPAASEVVAKNELSETCFASPAISDGRIFIRTTESLYCIGENRRLAPRARESVRGFE